MANDDQKRRLEEIDRQNSEMLAELNADIARQQGAVDATNRRLDRIEADIAELKKKIG
jgi:peptidoglycan hydrolase CwlO-like protein